VIRRPAVAGRFYPADPRDLEDRVRRFVADTRSSDSEMPEEEESLSRNTLACLVPHAGYVFSGGVAGAVYAKVDFPRRIIILGPRHRPRGADLAINTDGAWETPLGSVEIDSELAHSLLAACPLLENDEVAHRIEHSIEVQLPFLQVLAKDFRFVPIAIGTLDFEKLTQLGHALARVIAASVEPVLLIASSDMNHYEPDEITRAKDHLAIEQILALNPRGLHDTVRREKISMCGCGPVVATITAALDLGTTRTELVRYATSADVLGDRDDVVGYAGMLFR
jgi:AmmeMemoRadiSam system protein B